MRPSIASVLLFAVYAHAGEPVDLGGRRELFVDRKLIETMNGLDLRIHAPKPEETAIQFDRPWEGRFSAYITVLHDPTLKKYRMYYRGNQGVADGSGGEVTCYAESSDGVRWTKPSLGLHEINGSRENNVVLARNPPFTHNFAPFLDRRPGVANSERYKTLAGLGGKHGGLCAFASEDGIHWRKLQDTPVITKGAFDSQNVSFWSEAEQCYVAYFRIFTGGGVDEKGWSPKGVRWVSRATSKDFLSWSEAVTMSCDQPLVDQIYINQTTPYFNAPHFYIATAARFMPQKNPLESAEKAALAADTKAYPALVKDTSEAVLMSTRAGTAEYNRTFMEGFVRPGTDFRNWTSRSNYPACGIVPTGDSEISVYVEHHYGQTTAFVRRYSMRLDGFGSLHAGYAGGEMTTKPLKFTGLALHANISTGAAGRAVVEIQDGNGEVLPGFSAADCVPLSFDSTDRAFRWKDGRDLSALQGKSVRLKWFLSDADLFAFWFQ
jgi:hypothetical protein